MVLPASQVQVREAPVDARRVQHLQHMLVIGPWGFTKGSEEVSFTPGSLKNIHSPLLSSHFRAI